MAVTIAGRRFWLWRAVDDEGEVLDLLVQRRRDKAAAVKLMRKLLKKQGFAPAMSNQATKGHHARFFHPLTY
jgi:putative transposase